MNRLLVTMAASAILALSGCGKSPLSMEMVRSEMSRCPQASFLEGNQGKAKWDYTTGLELQAFLDVAERYCDKAVFDYAEQWYDWMVQDDGSITKYKVSEYSVDRVCPARTLFALYDKTGKEKYRKAIDLVHSQFAGHPKTSEGALWHKAIYPHQIWLDGLYMAMPFLAEYASRYLQESEKAGVYAEITNEFNVAARHTFDPVTGLYRHAWDESRSMFWCNPETGQSDHCWCRALGWMCMAVVETMPLVPDGTPGKKDVIETFCGIIDALPRYADPVTGMWFQVMDRPGAEGNYVEASGSAMFVYAMLKGIRLGYLDASLKGYALKCYDKLIGTFVRVDDGGLVNMDKICSVGGLGGKNMRRGDYAYYLSEKIVSNDPKGVGPLIWAALEREAF